MSKLYSLSEELKSSVFDTAKAVESDFHGLVKFIEYIVLPDYGEKIIIRFSLSYDVKSLEELDEIESKIRLVLGNDYWGDLLGDSFRKFGFDSDKMLDSLKKIDLKVDDEVIQFKETSYCRNIRKDKKIIRDMLNLSPQYRIWEIQPPSEDEPEALVLIIDKGVVSDNPYENERLFERKLKTGDQSIKAICFKDDKSFDALIKAYFLAEQHNLSLSHVIMNHQQI